MAHISEIKNNQLKNDVEKLLDYDYFSYTDITTDYDINLGYILDISDNSYFYENESDRDNDDKVIMEVLKDKFLY